ncbi:GNAT family N-acetyltransferase [Streptomyces sp. RS10V-4]|uniref:GNAT family N-acetyltransferase n=1 Tax=Streptomyces rhizoryzae TaxID=2932493 RepID=UPI002005AA69|nr:GNAT family N-acetyltransferase [Streptomyces rhizoryzae]MCK7623184.1 GNAT family N-acetyltransferase [Streptomyces rhizoryzae]
MTLTVRDFRPSDAKAVAELRRAALPFLIATPEGVAWQAGGAPPARRLRTLVAVLDGRVAGQINAGLLHDSSTPGQALATPVVHPAHRGRGAGRALLAAGEEHLAAVGATRLHAWTVDEPGSLAFAARHGYRPTRPAHFLRLDLARAALPPLPAALPPGVRLGTAADFGADPRPLFEADAEAAADEPADVAADAVAYADWLRTTWENPDIDLGLTTVVTVDGAVAAYTVAATDGRGRYVTAMTGCRRAFRGRGLARLAKTDALHRARDAGCTEAFTGNDAANAPMLAINRGLGYRPCGGELRHVRDLARG